VDGEKRELVMFDFDGVIVDSLDIFGGAFVDACAAEGVLGFTTVEDLLVVMEGNFYEAMRARGVDDARTAAVMGRVAVALVNARQWLRPFPLVTQVLADLADARSVVIVTSSPTAVVEGWLHAHGVDGVLEVAGAEAARSKVDKIRGLRERFPGQAVYWYVGDTAGDMREARAAGVTPVGVGWGWHEPEALVEAGAECIAPAPSELLTIVAPELARDFFGLG
jgi:phosphoglycolate phosphatase